MLRWTLKNLLAEPLRYFASAIGVASAFTLVIFFQAVFEGESQQIIAYPSHMDADVWVMQHGVSNMHMASSLVWDWKETRVAAIPGVQEVTSILYLNTVVSAGKKEWFSYVVGLDAKGSSAGPWQITRGQHLPGEGEVIVPDIVARLSGLDIGDNISIAARHLRIVGLSGGTFSMANSVFFINKQDLEEIMDVFGSISYILVKKAPDISAQVLAKRIMTEIDKVNALPATVFIQKDREMAMQMGTEIISTMTMFGSILATLIVAFSAYQQVANRQRELAIIKALGFNNTAIYFSAIMQTMLLTLTGLLIAIGASYTLLPLLPKLSPQISLYLNHEIFLPIGATAMVIAVIAAIWPARKVAKLDPMSVFQS